MSDVPIIPISWAWLKATELVILALVASALFILLSSRTSSPLLQVFARIVSISILFGLIAAAIFQLIYNPGMLRWRHDWGITGPTVASALLIVLAGSALMVWAHRANSERYFITPFGPGGEDITSEAKQLAALIDSALREQAGLMSVRDPRRVQTSNPLSSLVIKSVSDAALPKLAETPSEFLVSAPVTIYGVTVLPRRSSTASSRQM